MDNQDSQSYEPQIVAFRVGEAEYALEIAYVQEIVRVTHITRVPKAPNIVEGVINLRGTVVPLLNLHRIFGLKGKPLTEECRIVIAKYEGLLFGMLVDSASEVTRLVNTVIEAPPIVEAKPEHEFLLGVAKFGERLFVILDPKKLVFFKKQDTVKD